MILDDNLVSIDHEELSGGVITGNAIALNAFQMPGRMGPIPMLVTVSGDAAGGTGLALKLQQADEQGGSYEDVNGSEMTVAIADIQPGMNLGWRYVPAGVTKPWLKVVVTPTGTFTAGTVFAAVTREEVVPYVPGMYISDGVVKG